MQNTEITEVVTRLVAITGSDLSNVTKIVITPHDLQVSTTYVNGAGKVVDNTVYAPIAIALPEEK